MYVCSCICILTLSNLHKALFPTPRESAIISRHVDPLLSEIQIILSKHVCFLLLREDERGRWNQKIAPPPANATVPDLPQERHVTACIIKIQNNLQRPMNKQQEKVSSFTWVPPRREVRAVWKKTELRYAKKMKRECQPHYTVLPLVGPKQPSAKIGWVYCRRL